MQIRSLILGGALALTVACSDQGGSSMGPSGQTAGGAKAGSQAVILKTAVATAEKAYRDQASAVEEFEEGLIEEVKVEAVDGYGTMMTVLQNIDQMVSRGGADNSRLHVGHMVQILEERPVLWRYRDRVLEFDRMCQRRFDLRMDWMNARQRLHDWRMENDQEYAEEIAHEQAKETYHEDLISRLENEQEIAAILDWGTAIETERNENPRFWREEMVAGYEYLRGKVLLRRLNHRDPLWNERGTQYRVRHEPFYKERWKRHCQKIGADIAEAMAGAYEEGKIPASAPTPIPSADYWGEMLTTLRKEEAVATKEAARKAAEERFRRRREAYFRELWEEIGANATIRTAAEMTKRVRREARAEPEMWNAKVWREYNHFIQRLLRKTIDEWRKALESADDFRRVWRNGGGEEDRQDFDMVCSQIPETVVQGVLALLREGDLNGKSIKWGTNTSLKLWEAIADSRRRQGINHPRPTLGFYPDPEYRGAGIKVRRVVADFPAEQAGVRAGDVLLGTQDRDFEDVESLIAALRAAEQSDTWRLRVRRGGEIVVLSAELDRVK